MLRTTNVSYTWRYSHCKEECRSKHQGHNAQIIDNPGMLFIYDTCFITRVNGSWEQTTYDIKPWFVSCLNYLNFRNSAWRFGSRLKLSCSSPAFVILRDWTVRSILILLRIMRLLRMLLGPDLYPMSTCAASNDMIRYEIWCDMIYLLTAIGLTVSGSSTVYIYTPTIHRTTQ
jgi:hypothetical protein